MCGDFGSVSWANATATWWSHVRETEMEATVTSSDPSGERLLDSLICLPMFINYYCFNGDTIDEFTIKIIENDVVITILTEGDRYVLKGSGKIVDNLAIGDWHFEGVNTMLIPCEKDYYFTLDRMEKPYLHYSMGRTYDYAVEYTTLSVFNPGENYYVVCTRGMDDEYAELLRQGSSRPRAVKYDKPYYDADNVTDKYTLCIVEDDYNVDFQVEMKKIIDVFSGLGRVGSVPTIGKCG